MSMLMIRIWVIFPLNAKENLSWLSLAKAGSQAQQFVHQLVLKITAVDANMR